MFCNFERNCRLKSSYRRLKSGRSRQRSPRAVLAQEKSPLVSCGPWPICQALLASKFVVICKRYFSKTKRNAAKKNTDQCFSTEINATCKNSVYLEQKIKKKKIVTYPLFPLKPPHLLCVENKTEQNTTSVKKYTWPIHFISIVLLMRLVKIFLS